MVQAASRRPARSTALVSAPKKARRLATPVSASSRARLRRLSACRAMNDTRIASPEKNSSSTAAFQTMRAGWERTGRPVTSTRVQSTVASPAVTSPSRRPQSQETAATGSRERNSSCRSCPDRWSAQASRASSSQLAPSSTQAGNFRRTNSSFRTFIGRAAGAASDAEQAANVVGERQDHQQADEHQPDKGESFPELDRKRAAEDALSQEEEKLSSVQH